MMKQLDSYNMFDHSLILIGRRLIPIGRRLIPNISNNNGVIFDYGVVSTRIKVLIYSY